MTSTAISLSCDGSSQNQTISDRVQIQTVIKCNGFTNNVFPDGSLYRNFRLFPSPCSFSFLQLNNANQRYEMASKERSLPEYSHRPSCKECFYHLSDLSLLTALSTVLQDEQLISTARANINNAKVIRTQGKIYIDENFVRQMVGVTLPLTPTLTLTLVSSPSSTQDRADLNKHNLLFLCKHSRSHQQLDNAFELSARSHGCPSL